MLKSSTVFNTELEKFGHKFITRAAEVPSGFNSIDEERAKILAILFEQFLLFDRIAIRVDRQSLALRFLIKELGINKTEELIERGIIVPVLWTPMIFTSTGMTMPDGSIDHSAVIGKPPLVTGSLVPEDSDPERHLDLLLSKYALHRDRKRIFTRKVAPKFVLPDNGLATQSADIILDAYKNNRLEKLGLAALKEPDQLDYNQRGLLAELGQDVLETSVLAEKGYSSYDKYSYFNLASDAIKAIESGYNISENTSTILKVENVADLKRLVITGAIPFERVFDIRYKKVIKEYRKWINSISESTDASYITAQYINEIKGVNKFFETNKGKFIRNISMLGIGTAIGGALAGAGGYFAGAAAGKAADLALGMFDTYILDGLLKGWNPGMFVDAIKYEAMEDATLENGR